MKNLILFSIFFTSQLSLPHGEDKPGPNGGFISMPAAFHVEVLPVNSKQLKVYLLDMQWKNPTLKNSSVDLKIGDTAAKCINESNYFVCDFPSTINLNKTGELKVTAIREKQKGKEVKYSLPLKLK